MRKLSRIINNIKETDSSCAAHARERLDNLTKPKGSLGYLEDLARQIAAITGALKPVVKNKVIFTLAADHGVAEEGVSAYPKEVTAQMVYNFLRGGAAINVLARHIGARVVVGDMGVAEKIQNSLPKADLPQAEISKIQNFVDKKIGFGTRNMTKCAAMTREEAVKSIEAGMEIFEDEFNSGIDIAATGDMGIGNTTAASAITAVFTGRDAADVTGRGTGIDDDNLRKKIEVIERAIKVNKPNSEDSIDVLSKVGGFEIGGLAGIILTAASRKIPVVLDGFISGASALIAYKLQPKVKNYMIAGHCSMEKGHKVILDYIGLEPLLNLNLRLGEGTGAALAINIVETAVKILNEMATFEEASVSREIER